VPTHRQKLIEVALPLVGAFPRKAFGDGFFLRGLPVPEGDMLRVISARDRCVFAWRIIHGDRVDALAADLAAQAGS
jgi:hypothetical protein